MPYSPMPFFLPRFLPGPPAGSVAAIRARTWCMGERVDLDWEPPSGVTVTSYKLKRSRRTFPLYHDDDTEVVYTGTATDWSDINLEPNTIYYYGLFWTDDGGVTWQIDDFSRVAGLSIRDYAADEGTHWLYERLQAFVRGDDAKTGVDQYTLRRYMDVMQCGMSLFRGYIEAYELLTNKDVAPAGRIGDPYKQYAYLEGINEQLGFEPQRALGVEVMRRVALGITRVRRKKGTCPGLVEFVKLITGWDGTCAPVAEGTCGGGTLLRTWDGVSSSYAGSGSFVGPGFTSTTLDITAGQLTDTAAAWTVDLYASGVLIDFMGNVHCIASNTATTVTFRDVTEIVEYEEPFTGCTYAGFGTDTIVVTRVGAGKPFNTSQYNGAFAKTDDGTGKYEVLSCTANAAGDELTIVLDAATPALATLLVVADDYLNEPLSYANREASTRYLLLDGEHYFLWNPRFDERLRGTLEDPFDVLWSGSILSAVPYSDSDVVFWVDAGVAEVVSTSTALTDTVLTSSLALTPNALVGMYLNPNRNQTRMHRIVANDATTITIAPTSDMTQVAAVGNFFHVLSEHDSLRYQAVYNTVRRMLPFATRMYLWFL